MKQKYQSLIFQEKYKTSDELAKSTFLIEDTEYNLQRKCQILNHNYIKEIDVTSLKFLGFLLIFLKIAQLLTEYGCPIVINQIATTYEMRRITVPYTESYINEELIRLLLYLVFCSIAEYFMKILYNVQQRRFIIHTNIYLSKKLFEKSLKLYVNDQTTTFQGMLRELRQVEGATESFYTLIRVFFELVAGGLYLSLMYDGDSGPIFQSLKSGILVSLLSLVAASVAQLFAWRIQHYQDRRLKLTLDLLSGIKCIKYLQWEEVFMKKLFQVRGEEFKGISGIQYVDAFVNFFRRMSSVVLMFVTFYSMKQLPSSQFYTLLIFFEKFVYPLNTFPWCLGEFLGSWISAIRIWNYLNQPQVTEIVQSQVHLNEIVYYTPQVNKEYKVINRVLKLLQQCKGQEQQQECKQQIFSLHINLHLENNKLHIVIGSVGSGKSVLMDALLGEIQQGSLIGRQEDCSFVGQVPWVFAGTVRDNVLFGSPYEPKWYEECLRATDLLVDMADWIERDGKQVGQRGTNLSGGQRQRLALCRALYSNSRKYFLDDILSSLDEHVADIIIDRVVLGLLRGRTILLILNQAQYLKYADSIIEINQNQTKQCFRGQPRFQQLTQHTTNQYVEFRVPETKLIEEDIAPTTNREEQTFESTNNHQKNFRFYIRALGIKTTVFFLLVSLIQQGSKGMFELWTHSYMYSVMEGREPYLIFRDFQQTFLFLFIVLGGLTLLRGFAYSYATLKSAQSIFDLVIQGVLRAQVRFFDEHTTSYFIRRMFNDMQSIDDLPLNYFFSVALDSISLVFIISAQQMYVLPFCILCMYGCIRIQQQRIPYQEYLDTRSIDFYGNIQDLNTFVDETQIGIKVIRASRKQSLFTNIFQRILLFRYIQRLIEDRLIYQSQAWQTIIENGTFVLVVAAQIVMMQLSPHFDAVSSSLTLAFSYMLFGQHTLSKCAGSWQTLKSVSDSLERIRQLIEAPYEFQSTTPISIQNEKPLIEFNGVWLSYNDNATYALKNLTVTINRGDKVAFCGRTGSGKSSIMNLLARLYGYQRGTLYLFGQDVARIAIKSIRDRIVIINNTYVKSVIPQNGFLHQGSLLDNLNPTHDFPQEKIKQLIREHGLASSRIEQNLNNMESFQIEERGRNISSGEKQMINFVQQMIMMKEIVCVDEATSNMDQDSNDKVMNALMEMIGDRTLLLISHRLENLQSFDKIYIMKDGGIVDQGTYVQLQSSKYFQELKSQM